MMFHAGLGKMNVKLEYNVRYRQGEVHFGVL